MTTIAIDKNYQFVCDSRLIGAKVCTCKKWFKYKTNGAGGWKTISYFAFCGNRIDGLKFQIWAEDGFKLKKYPKLGENFLAMELRVMKKSVIEKSSGKVSIKEIEHKVFLWESECPHGDLLEEVNLSYSIGSGAGYAIGAMDYGASAKEAVFIAAKNDEYTGGEIVVIYEP